MKPAAEVFAEDWWPLEVAFVWVATGDRKRLQHFHDFTERRRRGEARAPTIGTYLGALQAMSEYGNVPGAIFRREARNDWKPGVGIAPAFDWTVKALTRAMWHRPARGRIGGDLVDIPPAAWRGAALVDDRKRGLCLVSGDTMWTDIDVPAAPFRKLRGKRGARPIGPWRDDKQQHRFAATLVSFAKARGTPTIAQISERSGLSEEVVARMSRGMNTRGRKSRKGRPTGSKSRNSYFGN